MTPWHSDATDLPFRGRDPDAPDDDCGGYGCRAPEPIEECAVCKGCFEVDDLCSCPGCRRAVCFPCARAEVCECYPGDY